MTADKASPVSVGIRSRPRILVVAPGFEPAVKAGGQARTLTNLVRFLEHDVVIDVIARDRDLGDREPFIGLSGRRVIRHDTTIYYLDDSSPKQVGSLLRLVWTRRYDLIMLNSFWSLKYAALPAILCAIGLLRGPVLLMPHGELEQGALRLKSRKKRLAAPFYRLLYRRTIDLFGATSDSESLNVRRWFPRQRVLATRNNAPDRLPFGTPPSDSASLRLLFLSRVHPKKGLLPLLRGLARSTRDIRLSILGPIEDDRYWRECLTVIATMPPHIRVSYQGVAQRADVAAHLHDSDCLVLLTAGENFGHVIAESLQAGCPVITTPTTPWTDVIARGGGNLVDSPDDSKQVATVIDTWATKPRDVLQESRRAARRAYEAFDASAGPDIVALALHALDEEGKGIR